MSNFDAAAFIDRIGKRLVHDFDDAGQATTPSQIGQAREVPVREQLEQILPRGIAVGSGCVIDSYGNTSQQIDVILYERDICPVFCINNTPETTYYPCEGVIGVGEVKSSLDTEKLRDSFAKIESVKRLKRHIVTPPPDLEYLPGGGRVVHYRGYGSPTTPSIIMVDDTDPEQDEKKHIFGFILSGKFILTPLTLLEKYVEFVNQIGDILSPNLLISLNDGAIYPFDKKKNQRPFSAQTASHFAFFQVEFGFRSLISYIYRAYKFGETSSIEAFHRYFTDTGTPAGPGFSMPKKVNG